MPKKRVAVSLRKPSPAPEPDAVTPVPPSAVSSVTPEASPPLTEGVVLREASPGPAASTIDAFVSGAAAALTQATREIPPAKLEEMLRRGPEGYRELTIYLPEELALKLTAHCLEHDVDLSRLVAAALEQHLRPGVAEPSAAEPRRRAEDSRQRHWPGNLGSDSALALVARSLLGELTDWLRSIWSTRRRNVGSPAAPVAS